MKYTKIESAIGAADGRPRTCAVTIGPKIPVNMARTTRGLEARPVLLKTAMHKAARRFDRGSILVMWCMEESIIPKDCEDSVNSFLAVGHLTADFKGLPFSSCGWYSHCLQPSQW